MVPGTILSVLNISTHFFLHNSLKKLQTSIISIEISIENKFLKVPKLVSGEDKISTLIDWLKNLCSQSISILNKIILPVSYVLLDWQIHSLLQISHWQPCITHFRCVSRPLSKNSKRTLREGFSTWLVPEMSPKWIHFDNSLRKSPALFNRWENRFTKIK